MSIKHKRKSLLIVLFLLLFSVGCKNTSEFESITLESHTVSDYYEVGSLNLEDIKFTITLTSGEKLIVSGSDFSLSDEDLAKLEIPGTHLIKLIYKDELSYELEVILISSEEFNTFLSLYKMGLSSGAIDISYEEWLNSIRGEDGKDGKQIFLQVSNSYIQFQYEGDTTWTNLISLEDLVGPSGNDGEDGKKLNLQVFDNFIQYQYEDDLSWTNLISLDDLRGTNGSDGEDGSEIVMQVTSTHIQWKYENDTQWHNLIDLETLSGDEGIGILNMEINEEGELLITYTNDEVINLGKINVYYTVKFVGLNGNLLDIKYVLSTDELEAPSAPTIEGYTFIGWDKDLSTISSDTTVNALYVIKKYTITFDTQGGSHVESILDITYGSTVNLPTPTKEGYIFKGWYTGLSINDSQLTNSTLIKQNQTVYAKWELGIYTVKFVNFEHHVFDEIAVDHGGSVTPPTALDVTGYTFIGWSESMNNITQNLIVKAMYNINTYTITFDSNDGSLAESITQDYLSTVIAPTNPTKDGYTFMGWYEDITLTLPYIFTTMPAYDETLYASWELNTYSIEYSLYDGTNASNPSSYTIESPNITLLNPTKTGHTFGGWYDNTSFTGSQILTIPSGTFKDIILYAKWNINSYDIAYEFVTNDYNPLSSIYLQPNETIIKVYAGDIYSSLYTSLGRIFMWGANGSGQLGNGNLVSQSTPLDITQHFSLYENESIIKVSYGEYHASAITSLNRIFMWGENMHGQLGDGTSTDKLTPLDITTQFTLNIEETVIEMFLGNDVSSAITSTGRIFMWGYNGYHQLADGIGLTRRTPVDMTSYFNLNPGDTISNLTFSLSHSVAYTTQGRVLTWGNNSFGQLGDGTTIEKISPTDMTHQIDLHLGETIVDAYAGGRNYTAALTSESRVFMWGLNDDAQLGDNTRINKLTPTEITSYFNLLDGETITALGIGKFHNTATSSNNRIFTWGYDMTIQLGDYGFTHKIVPTDISSYFDLSRHETILEMTIGESHTFFLTSQKRLIIWGSNHFGQLGDGTSTQINTPIELYTYTHLTPYIEMHVYDSLIHTYQPNHDAYRFSGWYLDMSLTNPYTFERMPASDLKLYGKWLSLYPEIDYTVNDGYISIDKFYGTNTDYEIPSSIASIPVTEIKPDAFSNQTSLTSLFIPESILTIGENAFESVNSNLIIMTSHLSKPEGWDLNWNVDDKTVIWGYSDPTSISNLLAYENGTSVTIQGIYTGNSTVAKYWIQDNTGGIYIYVPYSLRETLSAITPGVEIYVRGTYNSLSNPSYISIDSLDDLIVINPVLNLPMTIDLSSLALNDETLSSYQGKLVSLLGYHVKESILFTSGQPFTFTLTNGVYDILVSVNSGIDEYVLLDVKLNGSMSNTNIDLSLGVLTLNGGIYQIEIIGDDLIVYPREK